MKKKLLEGQLKQILQESPVPSNETLLASTLLLAEKELSKKQSRKRISFPRFLQKQIIYIGWKIWSIQGLFLLAAVSILSDFSDYMKNPRHLARLLLCLSVAVCMTALPMLFRCARYRMQEIEAAARFSSVKLLLARLIVIGAGDLCLLTGIFLTTIIKTALPADSAILCLCVPFLSACGGCLFMLGHLPPGQFFRGSLLFCSLLILLSSVFTEQYAFFFQPLPWAAWMAICALLLIFCAGQLRYVMHASSYTETQIA